MVTIYIGNIKSRIVGLKFYPSVTKSLDQELSYLIQGHQFIQFKNGWDGRYRLFDKKHTFYTGFLSRVESVLIKHGIEYQIEDNRLELEYGKSYELDPESGFEPRNYQQEVVDKAIAKGSGIIKVATGGGKAFIISMIAAKYNIPTVVYVIGIELLYQMQSTFNKAFPDMKVGVVGDGQCDIQKVTIATVWSAAAAFNKKIKLSENDYTGDSARKNKALNKEAIRQMVNDAELLIFDECQYIPGKSAIDVCSQSKSARHKFLLSGTPFREGGDDMLIEAVGGDKLCDISASRLIREGWLVKPKIYFLNVPSKKGIGQKYQDIYQNYIVENETRNTLVIRAVKRLLEDNRKVLILVTKVSHGKILLDLLLEEDIKAKSLDGRDNTKNRLNAINDIKEGHIDVIIASRIFDQGIDIPQLNGLILTNSGKSRSRALQRIGRVIRKAEGKFDALVVEFWDNAKYLREHSVVRKETYEVEPEFKIILSKD